MRDAGPLAPALQAIGHRPEDVARRPLLHGNGQALATIGLPGPDGTVAWVGILVAGETVTFYGPPPPTVGPSRGHKLRPPTAELVDRISDAIRVYLERIEELDEKLSETQQRGRSVPTGEVWGLQRRSALLRAQIGRTMVALAELSGPFVSAFPDLADVLPTVEADLGRVQQLCANLQQSLSDLILLRNAEESNRIAEIANQLSQTSNRIASLANTSNIRMLGLTYIALVFGLVTLIVLFPNTGGTILGMPSAAWVPGVWVDVILIVLAVVPTAILLSRPWVRLVLARLPEYEVRTGEGLGDLPELGPEGTPSAGRPRPPDPAGRPQ